MSLFSDFILAAAICAAVFCFLWLARGVMLIPFIAGRDIHLEIVVKMTGEGQNLEQVIKGLLWLKDSGNTAMTIVVDGENASEIGWQKAEIAANKYKEISLRGFHADERQWKKTQHNS